MNSAYGTWKSPITADLIVSESIGLGSPTLDGEDVYWIEMRPSEKGRSVLVKHEPDGTIHDVTPPGFNVRTRVHEYGGGAYAIQDSIVYFSNFSDQQMYGQRAPLAPPVPFTQQPNLRFADGVIDRARNRFICICEDHRAAGSEPFNTLVSFALQPISSVNLASEIVTLANGYDFFSSPRLSPDGQQLAWLTWDHPNMPWDGTELWLAEVKTDGLLRNARVIAGGAHEAICQPQWSPDGVLHFVSDRTGWWNLYRHESDTTRALCPKEAEFGQPPWVFGMSNYAFADNRTIVCSYLQQGFNTLALLDVTNGQLTNIETPFSRIDGLRAADGAAYFLAGSPTETTRIVRFALTTRSFETLRASNQLQLDAGYLSAPQAIEFPTADNQTAHAFFYAPRNNDFTAPAGEKPPLLVMSHGGPTAMTTPTLDLEIQYWTSRGIAVLDVNYGGSTGFGRAYRERLKGNWGIIDVDDCTNGALYLAEQSLVDGNRLAITGGSAGGYTTLAALTFRNVFKAGASHYGVSDLTALARDTHKFEARYLDGLIGPYPQRQDLYDARSPIKHTDQLNAPVIFFQGLEDKIVPPDQAERMVAALRQKGLPVAYVAFEGEQHGFRQAANIKRALDGEFYFYARVFGFCPADEIEPVPIENLP